MAHKGEILASFDSGLPLLMKEAKAEGPDAVAELHKRYEDALLLLPAK